MTALFDDRNQYQPPTKRANPLQGNSNRRATADENVQQSPLQQMIPPRDAPGSAPVPSDIRADDRRVYETNDGRGHAVRITQRGGVNVHLADSTGEWDSTDGTRWVLRGSNGNRIWYGTVGIDANGDYVSRGTHSGVTQVEHPDGTRSQSITTSTGQTIEIRTNAQGTATYVADSTGIWTSTDGRHWTNATTGATSNSRVRIDRFGQYQVQYDGQPEHVEAQSRELTAVTERQRRLTNEYGVTFSEPGSQITQFNVTHTVRPPSMEELDVLERVLDRNRQMDVRGLQFTWVQSSASTDASELWGVHSATANDGRPRITLYPRAEGQLSGWSALEGTLQHELVHYEQTRNWGNGQWNRSAPTEARQLMQDLGWVYDEPSQTYRMLDRQNNQWQYNADRRRWDPIIGGHPEPGRSISNDEMRARARVTPATGYFSAPWEMHAEAMALYRHDGEQLLRDNPAMYELMQQQDQREINRRFGTTGGQPNRIRNTAGAIVPNTPENRRQLPPRPNQIATR